MLKTKALFERRKQRNRFKVRKLANGRPRLSVFRSSKQIYAQIIDDRAGVTLAAASSVDKDLKGKLSSGANVEAAAEVGKLIAARAKEAGVETVVFDRGAYQFHGRVKALADAAPTTTAAVRTNARAPARWCTNSATKNPAVTGMASDPIASTAARWLSPLSQKKAAMKTAITHSSP